MLQLTMLKSCKKHLSTTVPLLQDNIFIRKHSVLYANTLSKYLNICIKQYWSHDAGSCTQSVQHISDKDIRKCTKNDSNLKHTSHPKSSTKLPHTERATKNAWWHMLVLKTFSITLLNSQTAVKRKWQWYKIEVEWQLVSVPNLNLNRNLIEFEGKKVILQPSMLRSKEPCCLF